MGICVCTESPTQHGLLSVTELGVCSAFSCLTSSDGTVTLLGDEYASDTLCLLAELLGEEVLVDGKICRRTLLGVENDTVELTVADNDETCSDGVMVTAPVNGV